MKRWSSSSMSRTLSLTLSISILAESLRVKSCVSFVIWRQTRSFTWVTPRMYIHLFSLVAYSLSDLSISLNDAESSTFSLFYILFLSSFDQIFAEKMLGIVAVDQDCLKSSIIDLLFESRRFCRDIKMIHKIRQAQILLTKSYRRSRRCRTASSLSSWCVNSFVYSYFLLVNFQKELSSRDRERTRTLCFFFFFPPTIQDCRTVSRRCHELCSHISLVALVLLPSIYQVIIQKSFSVRARSNTCE